MKDICPMISGPGSLSECYREQCAWWSDTTGACCVRTLAAMVIAAVGLRFVDEFKTNQYHRVGGE